MLREIYIALGSCLEEAMNFELEILVYILGAICGWVGFVVKIIWSVYMMKHLV